MVYLMNEARTLCGRVDLEDGVVGAEIEPVLHAAHKLVKVKIIRVILGIGLLMNMNISIN